MQDSCQTTDNQDCNFIQPTIAAPFEFDAVRASPDVFRFPVNTTVISIYRGYPKKGGFLGHFLPENRNLYEMKAVQDAYATNLFLFIFA